MKNDYVGSFSFGHFLYYDISDVCYQCDYSHLQRGLSQTQLSVLLGNRWRCTAGKQPHVADAYRKEQVTIVNY